MRARPGKHLTREGVRLARDVGVHLGAFDLVVTSDVPRAIETAVAMGYASDRQIEDLGSLFGADDEVDWESGCAAIAEALPGSKRLARAARKHAELLTEIAVSLPEGGRALLVSHGGVVELGVVGLLPAQDFSSWNPWCGYCEGVRLTFEGDACTAAHLLRLADLLPPS
jgi:broad specificity phosphatase PhoE